MCGRAYRKTPSGDLARYFDAEARVEAGPSFNVGPTQDVLAVRQDKAGHRELVALHWGLVPPWVKDDGKRHPSLHNAKAETAHEKPAFRSAFKRRRCLVVFDGFYEWERSDPKKKRPFVITRRDGAPLAMAGLWEHSDVFDLDSSTVLTTTANTAVAGVHERMPVLLLDAEAQRTWLDPSSSPEALRALLTPCDPGPLLVYEVGPAVGQIKNNDATLLAPLPPSSSPSSS